MEYSDVLWVEGEKIGEFKHFTVDVRTKGVIPTTAPLPRFSPMEQKRVAEHIRIMEKNGVVQRKSQMSMWNSRFMLLRKRSGQGDRPILDLRQVNENIKNYPHYIPRVEDLLNQLAEAALFTSLDLVDGFSQIQLSRRNIFIFNARRLLQLLQTTIRSKNFSKCVSKSHGSNSGWNQIPVCYLLHWWHISLHKRKWGSLLEAQTGLTKTPRSESQTQARQVQICQTKVNFLGHQISQAGISPLTSNVEAIISRPAPKTKRQVQQFLGMVNYYRNYVPRCSEICSPSYALTASKTKSIWSRICQDSFDKLKEKLSSAPILRPPGYSRPFYLQTDGSQYAIAAVLSQVDKHN